MALLIQESFLGQSSIDERFSQFFRNDIQFLHHKVGNLTTETFCLPKDNHTLSIHPSNNLQLQKLLQPRTPIEPSKAALPHPTMRQRGFVVYGHVVDVDGSGLLR